MNQLNLNTYNQLLKANEEATKIFSLYEGPAWYELTYDMFKASPLENMNDFWKIVAYTYSWMPTIPVVKSHLIKDPDKLLQQLHALKKSDDSQLKELFQELIPVINNSLVGVSKILHFIAPERIPIIDRNVLRGWNIFFQHNSEYSVCKLPGYRTSLNHNHIPKYISYRDTMIKWVENGNHQFTMRDLEFAFFELGKNAEEELRVNHPILNL